MIILGDKRRVVITISLVKDRQFAVDASSVDYESTILPMTCP